MLDLFKKLAGLDRSEKEIPVDILRVLVDLQTLRFNPAPNNRRSIEIAHT